MTAHMIIIKIAFESIYNNSPTLKGSKLSKERNKKILVGISASGLNSELTIRHFIYHILCVYAYMSVYCFVPS